VTALAIALCVLCQVFLVVGQVLLKRAMAPATASAGLRAIGVHNLLLGIACLTAWFFLWVGLLQRWELSQIFPFEGLNPALLVVASWLFLDERLPRTAWVAIALITTGVVLVSGS
jgi:uncharacterized membrane protein